MAGNTNEVSVDYDTITGRPLHNTRGLNETHGSHYENVHPPQGAKPAGSRPGGRPATGSTSTGGKAGLDMTSTMSSVNYDPLADGSGSNVDADGYTPIGIEIKERFKSMRKAFLKMDQNRDGRITGKELLNMCRQWNIPQAEAERVLRAADLDHNGTLDFNEFAQRFDPFEGDSSFGSDGLSPTGIRHGGGADDRPIKSSGWDMGAGGGDETAMPPPPSRHAGGNAAHKGREEHAPAPVAGSGSRAARGLSGEGGGAPQDQSELNMLRARNAELEEELDRYKAKVAALEKVVEQLASKDAALEKELQQRELDVTQLARGNQDAQAAPPTASRGLDGGAGSQQHQSAAGGAGSQQHRSAAEANPGEEEEDDPHTVYVYGKDGDKKTNDMHKALKSAEIPFVARNFDSDKRYMKPLKESGGGSASAPVVTLGSKAWWDDGGGAQDDAMFAIPFPSAVASELRHSRLQAGGGHASEPPPVRMDADIDTEIAERFHSMQQAFLKLDDNKDGRISKKELLAKCQQWNIPMTEAQRIVAEADLDHNGTLDFNEFARRFNGARGHGSQANPIAKKHAHAKHR